MLTRFIATCLLVSSTAAQTSFVVDAAGGPGSTHTTIGAAIAAASDGDAILIRDGLYQEVIRIDGKDLRLQAEAGANVQCDGFEIMNLAADQAVAIRGIVQSFTAADSALSSNLGPIWIEGVDSANSPFPHPGWRITDCSSVVFRDAIFDRGLSGPLSTSLTSRMDIRNSTVALYESEVRGPNGTSCHPILPTCNGLPAIYAVDSVLTLYSSLIVGGNGGTSQYGNGGGAAAVSADNSLVTVIDTTARGGYCCGGGPGVRAAPFLTAGGAQIDLLPSAGRKLSVASPVREGATASLVVEGEPGDLALAVVAFEPSNLVMHPNWVGPSALLPPLAFLDLGVLPSSGTSSLLLTLPVIPGPSLIHTVYLQGLFLSATEIVIGTPTQLHIIDTSL